MFKDSKPYTAVTVQIERLTSESYEEEDISGIFDLVEVIRIQNSGPTEAARAIRKKLKYGNAHRKLRALVVVDGLLENAGSRFQRTFADEPLLERLRLLARDDVTDPRVRTKCILFFNRWTRYRDTAGLEGIANLYNQLPQSTRSQKSRKANADTEHHTDRLNDEHDSSGRRGMRPGPAPTSSSTNPTTSLSSRLTKHKRHSSKPFNLEREKENMMGAIAQASIASTNLLNGLQLINRETERVSENPTVVERFETCRKLRGTILHYIQHVESDNWIGSLVNANDELVKALTAYEIFDRSIDDDSDSDQEEDATRQLDRLSLNDTAPIQPLRPRAITMPSPPQHLGATPVNDEAKARVHSNHEDDDPFGDSNAVATPGIERPGMTWRQV